MCTGVQASYRDTGYRNGSGAQGTDVVHDYRRPGIGRVYRICSGAQM